MSKASVTRIFNLENVAQAREFLENLYISGRGKVDHVITESGREVSFKDCTDEEAVSFARQLYELQPKDKWSNPGQWKIKERYDHH